MIDNDKNENSRFENSRESGGDVFEKGNGSHNGPWPNIFFQKLAF